MASLSSLPSQLIEIISNHIDAACILALRFSNRTILSKCQYTFHKLFATIKISFCLFSVNALDQLSLKPHVADKIQRLTIGTKRLDQYAPFANNKNEFWNLLNEETEAKDTISQRMLDICRRLSNLKSIVIEDRPLGVYFTDESHRCRLGSEEFQRKTDINMRWTDLSYSGPASGEFVYRTMRALVDSLDRDVQLSSTFTASPWGSAAWCDF